MRDTHLSVRAVSWRPNNRAAPVLHPTSFDANRGEVVGIVGPNGAGKSTLLRLLYRFHKPASGAIEINGDDLWDMPPRRAAKLVAAVLQEQASGFGLTVEEMITLGRTPHRQRYFAPDLNDTAVTEHVIDRLGLSQIAQRPFDTLSGGERQRVMVARALAQEPHILIMDEPTNHLDIRHQLQVIDLIRNLDLTIVVSLHDLNMAAEVCDKILLLENGHPQGFGPPAELLTETLVSAAFGVEARRERLAPSNQSHLTFHLP